MKYKVTKQSCIFENLKPQEAIFQSLKAPKENDSIIWYKFFFLSLV